MAEHPVISISLRANDGTYWVWGMGDYTPADNVLYIKCDNEFDLLTKFVNYWSTHTPDAITGWNTQFFDIPYLINRMRKLTGDDKMSNRLSPWGYCA